MTEVSVVVLLMLIKSLMEAGGYREIRVDELRRAVAVVGDWLRYRFKEKRELQFKDFLIDPRHDIAKDIEDFILSLENSDPPLADRYRADGEVLSLVSEETTLALVKNRLDGIRKEDKQTLLPFIQKARDFYQTCITQRRSCD